MAKSASEKLEKLQMKKIEYTEKMEKLKEDIKKVDADIKRIEEEILYEEFLAWRKGNKAGGNMIEINEVGADAASDNAILEMAVAGQKG